MLFEEREPQAPVFRITLLAILYFAVTLIVSSRMFVPTGDEPHYLAITQSLVEDHDISLVNNYENRHYRPFYPGLLPKRTTASGDATREIPTFSIGLPLILAPFYKLATTFFPSYLVTFLRLVVCAFAVAAVYQLMKLAQHYDPSVKAGVIVLGGAALASPLITYSSMFYPEIFGFLLITICLRQWSEMEEDGWRAVWWLGAIPGLLVWLHPKYLALAFLISGISTYFFHRTFQIYGKGKTYSLQTVHLLLAILGVVTFFLFLHYEYGSWSPNRIYGGWKKHISFGDLILQEGPERAFVMVRMLIGFWVDQRFGILPFAPLYAAFFPAIVWALKNARAAIWPVALIFAGHYLALSWGAPTGGFAPPSRHFVVMIPMILLTIVLIFSRWKLWQKLLFGGLVLVSLLITFLMLTNYRKIFSNVTWRNQDGLSDFWQLYHLERWIPSLTATNLDFSIILFWISLFGLIALLLYPRRAPEPAPDATNIVVEEDLLTAGNHAN